LISTAYSPGLSVAPNSGTVSADCGGAVGSAGFHWSWSGSVTCVSFGSIACAGSLARLAGRAAMNGASMSPRRFVARFCRSAARRDNSSTFCRGNCETNRWLIVVFFFDGLVCSDAEEAKAIPAHAIHTIPCCSICATKRGTPRDVRNHVMNGLTTDIPEMTFVTHRRHPKTPEKTCSVARDRGQNNQLPLPRRPRCSATWTRLTLRLKHDVGACRSTDLR
jgi:hypothetical protein